MPGHSGVYAIPIPALASTNHARQESCHGVYWDTPPRYPCIVRVGSPVQVRLGGVRWSGGGKLERVMLGAVWCFERWKKKIYTVKRGGGVSQLGGGRGFNALAIAN